VAIPTLTKFGLLVRDGDSQRRTFGVNAHKHFHVSESKGGTNFQNVGSPEKSLCGSQLLSPLPFVEVFAGLNVSDYVDHG
jgi:hypothetical protein